MGEPALTPALPRGEGDRGARPVWFPSPWGRGIKGEGGLHSHGWWIQLGRAGGEIAGKRSEMTIKCLK